MSEINTGDIIRLLRNEKRYSQKQLAEILNVAQNTVSNWEKGTREPDNSTLKKLSEIFNVSTDYLLGTSDTKNTDKEIPNDFSTPEEAIKFILEKNVIMGFGGFDVNKLSDEEVVEFANELLNQLRLLSYKYKK